MDSFGFHHSMAHYHNIQLGDPPPFQMKHQRHAPFPWNHFSGPPDRQRGIGLSNGYQAMVRVGWGKC